MKRYSVAVAVLVVTSVLISLAGCSSRHRNPNTKTGLGLAASPWPKFCGNLQNSGTTAASPKLTGKKWVAQTGTHVLASAAIGMDGTVYVSSEDGKLHALDPKSGRTKWIAPTVDASWLRWMRRQKIPDFTPAISSPTIGANGLVYVGSKDGCLYAIDAATGRRRWRFASRGNIVANGSPSSPSIGGDGTVFITNGQDLQAIDGATGMKRWDFRPSVKVKGVLTEGGATSSAAIGGDGTVFVTSLVGLFALDPRTGKKKWEFTNHDISCDPAIGPDGTVYAGDYSSMFYALDGRTGKKKWESRIERKGVKYPDKIMSCPAIGPDGTAYAVSEDGMLFAFDRSKGHIKWRTPLNVTGSHEYPVVAPNGNLYIEIVKSANKPKMIHTEVVSIDCRTGKPKKEILLETGLSASTAPIAVDSDGTIYAGTWSGRVYAIK